VVKRVGAMVVGAALLMWPASGAFAEREAVHGADDRGAPAAAPIVVKETPAEGARPHVVVTGAPSQSVVVQAPPGVSVSAVGGPGAPGKAGAPGKQPQ